MIRLINQIQLDFEGHKVEPVYMNVKDVINLPDIKDKAEALLQKHMDDEIDIFFSPGTSIMQLSWFLCHTNLGLNTRLLQMRPAKKSAGGKPELLEIKVDSTPTPITSIIKERNIEKREAGLWETTGFKQTDSMQPIYDKAFKIARAENVTTLITGMSGTGKEHMANFIHQNSLRNNQPFITINCSAFNDSLLESRLFGYMKGSFTGAEKDTQGLFEKANGGTIFLDEIGDISAYMQQALLRVLQEKEITPVGGTPKKVDVRIITATNKDLVQLCTDGVFRWDLYYRLAVAEIELPSLISRGPKDIKEMLDYFIRNKKKELKRDKLLEFDSEAMKVLLEYNYPGNIREMENLVESLYVYCDGKVKKTNLPDRLTNLPIEFSLNWRDVEKQHIEKVLKLKKGNQRQAWLALGYGSLNTFKKKLQEYEIRIEE
jgi:transcriptional regulator with PAS, ATPase and Fis domain